MHELSIAQAIIDRIEDLCREEGGAMAEAVHLSVGGLSGVDPVALEYALPIAAVDTALAETVWDVKPIRATVQCRSCGISSVPDDVFAVCGACGSMDVEVIAGREMLIDSVDLA